MKNRILFIIIILIIQSCGNGFKNLGDDYYLSYNQMDEVCLITPAGRSGDLIVIYGKIVDHDFDEDFIIAVEQRRDSIIVDKYLGKQYYILTKHNDSLFGPMSKSDFYKTKKTLGVPNNLNVK